ncbi:hypothetical protein V4C53_10540 [Paraburkholderia azotifigens]|uniref:hypothetical protein n=1 Tax=Paraburkholderia azotifigens TaxID=2057004 RepID=UPI003174676B
MINLTDKLVYVGSGPNTKEITEVIDQVCADTAAYAQGTSRSKHCDPYAFGDMFARASRRQAKLFDRAFLDDGLRLTCSPSQGRTLGVLAEYCSGKLPSASGMPYVASGIRLVLLHLWDAGKILLPTTFLPNVQANFINSATLESFNVQLKGWKKAEYVAHFLRATDWKQPEDIDICEAADFIRAQWLAERGSYAYSFTSSPIPVSAFLANMSEQYHTRVKYGTDALSQLANWSANHKQKCSFKEYLEDPDKYARQVPPARPKKSKASRPHKAHSSPSPDTNFIHSALKEATVQLSHAASADERNDAILNYFRTTSVRFWNSHDSISDIPEYQYREHAKPSPEITGPWIKAWNAYIAHRRLIERIQDTGPDRATRNILFLYLFCYLPWWKELFPGGLASIPDRVDKFTTFPFFVNLLQQQLDGSAFAKPDVEKYPTPFRDFIKLFRSSDESANVAIRCLRFFFQVTLEYHSTDPLICDGPFQNPILSDLNYPSSKPSRTNKVTVPVDIEGHLTMFMYSVEAFGEFLLESALENQLSAYNSKRSTESTEDFWDTDEAGYIPFYWYRGKFHPIKKIPPVFYWRIRQVRRKDGKTSAVRIPHLTTLRLCAAGNESGQRFQHIQWLDIETWDAANQRDPSDSAFTYGPKSNYTFVLYVNTDKTRTTGHDTLIVYRARACLLREEKFQTEVCTDMSTVPVLYEGRENSHFEPIVPLFQSAQSTTPVSDSAYQRIWFELMFGFQRHYAGLYKDADINFVAIKPPAKGESSTVSTLDGVEYSKLTYITICTPHSSRATFTTNRYGVLEVSETGFIIGHSDSRSTNYYYNPSLKALATRMASADATIHRDFLPLEEGVIIRADKPESALVEAFKADRDGTIASFGFMRPFTLWGFQTLDTIAEGAFDQLATNPMSRIVFRETHVCPAGEECPEELVVKTGEAKRCGMCPLAMKCVDHLQAIEAKINLLDERIKFNVAKRAAMEKDKEPLKAINAVWDATNLDANEMIGWKHSKDTLEKIRQEMLASAKHKAVYYAFEPEIVKKQLERVTVDASLGLQLATRIIEAGAFPAFNTEALDIQARALKRRLLAGKGLPKFDEEIVNASPAVAVTSMLRVIMRELPETFEQIMQSLGEPQPSRPELTL